MFSFLDDEIVAILNIIKEDVDAKVYDRNDILKKDAYFGRTVMALINGCLVNNYAEHLGVKIPIIYLPVSPGKNVSVIVEVAAMNVILKSVGYDAAEDFNRKINDEIRKKTMQKNFEGKGDETGRSDSNQ